ncbi:E3 ubiquitin-protein ligase COP1 [Smittium culicis]|uniref:E3 ubiquitin-protein ligase COP1 n=1 Tax=Smittium culicis TaxID=133412 RepID=A0A1R1X7H6_9FUNG|nr:E3 ubiquitin-protein ligase COP1 [Smittium culicis]
MEQNVFQELSPIESDKNQNSNSDNDLIPIPNLNDSSIPALPLESTIPLPNSKKRGRSSLIENTHILEPPNIKLSPLLPKKRNFTNFSNIDHLPLKNKETISSKIKSVENSISTNQNHLLNYFMFLLYNETKSKLRNTISKLQTVGSDIALSIKDHKNYNNQVNCNFNNFENFLLDNNFFDELISFSDIDLSDTEKNKIIENLDDLEKTYFSIKQKSLSDDKPEDFSSLKKSLYNVTQYTKLEPEVDLRYGDGSNSAAIVSSIEFDKDEEMFAVSGITRKIKIYNYLAVQKQAELWEIAEKSKKNRLNRSRSNFNFMNKFEQSDTSNEWWPINPHESLVDQIDRYPSAGSDFSIGDLTGDSSHLHLKHVMPISPESEIVNRYKISCLSYNKYHKNYLACSDYEGLVNVYDTSNKSMVVQFNEHEKRTWSVDFSRTERNRLCSGSDDCRVKIWNLNNRRSVMTIEGKANVCCVRFSPGKSNIIAYGSADHNVHCYDLRFPTTPLAVLKEHRKAVSYVRFISDDLIVSASTDSSLKLWDLKSNTCVKTYLGHTNEKNFVGLGTNEISEKDTPFFVSAVCWKNKTNNLIAANSSGSIRILGLK